MSIGPILDAAQTAIFARQLEEVDTQLYNANYPQLEALQFVSVKPIHPGADSYTYSSFDEFGVAKIHANYANGGPRVDVAGVQTTAKLVSVSDSYGWNIQEIRAAQFASIPLDAMKAVAARRAIDRAMNKLALMGNAETNLPGLFNAPGVPLVNIPADGTGTSKLWSTKTGALMLRDMLLLVDSIPVLTKEIENANTLLLPKAQYRLAASTRLSETSGAATDRTVLEQFRILRPDVTVKGAMLLETASASTGSRMVAYNSAREYVEWLVAVPFEQLPTMLDGYEYITNCHARAGGVAVRYPLSFAYGDGI